MPELDPLLALLRQPPSPETSDTPGYSRRELAEKTGLTERQLKERLLALHRTGHLTVTWARRRDITGRASAVPVYLFQEPPDA